jgi:hypothetical protein
MIGFLSILNLPRGFIFIPTLTVFMHSSRHRVWLGLSSSSFPSGTALARLCQANRCCPPKEYHTRDPPRRHLRGGGVAEIQASAAFVKRPLLHNGCKDPYLVQILPRT